MPPPSRPLGMLHSRCSGCDGAEPPPPPAGLRDSNALGAVLCAGLRMPARGASAGAASRPAGKNPMLHSARENADARTLIARGLPASAPRAAPGLPASAAPSVVAAGTLPAKLPERPLSTLSSVPLLDTKRSHALSSLPLYTGSISACQAQPVRRCP